VIFCPQCSVYILYGGWITLIFLIWQNLLWRRLEVPSSSYGICNAKDMWTQADPDMKHHACQLASGSTIRYNLGPQSSINIRCHHKILGTRKVKWSKFQYSEPTSIMLHHTKFHHQATWHPDLCTSKYSEIKLKILTGQKNFAHSICTTQNANWLTGSLTVFRKRNYIKIK